ncbi:CCA tRNA nucleotidyltransferase [Porphyromonas sp.]|uniref:CCA tRNA nucleotidyltransferase n=1 Tax=Porphyromonas sp. TaxID=1924944 RepID=UPI0026DD7F8E|nr:CCA tRNA nucleotidyltransferase [Porphyromonas sp.]MDO4771613.1 CCA tRNA nucleotidyltransferase [Porphyromonas sp.]
MIINKEDILNELTRRLGKDLIDLLADAAEMLDQEIYVIGGFVRDIIMERPSDDLDIVTNKSGIALATEVTKRLGKREAHLSVFKSFGTAQVKFRGLELEFVGARKESYRADSRKPIVEDGTFEDDQKRRDFTINALSISLNRADLGTLIDPFDGVQDIEQRIIRTPLDPDTTFSDDPLRMMRAVRFASQLDFTVPQYIKDSILRNASRISIVSRERIMVEFVKIMMSPRPSIGLLLMDECGLMQEICPEVTALKGAETREGIGHKDNFHHTLIVVDQLSEKTDNLYLRFAALFHDIAKPATKRYEKGIGWTFYNHNYVGSKMLPKIFKRLKLPLDERMKYVQKLVNLHMRPAQLSEEGVTDSAVRRLLFEAGEDIDDLMLLCEADMTSKNPIKIAKCLANFKIVRNKLVEIEEKDRIRNFQPPVSGEEIMKIYNLSPCRQVGDIKEAIKNAILDGVIPNEHEAALEFMYRYVKEHRILS